MALIKKTYHVKFGRSLRRISLMIIGLLGMQMSFMFLDLIGLQVLDQSRLVALVELGVYGLVGILVYVGITGFLQLPQNILNLDFKRLVRRLKR